MKFAMFSMVFAVTVMATTNGAIEPIYINQQENELYSVVDEDKEFEAWKAKYDRSYETTKEEERRKRIWMANRIMIEEHQKKYEKGQTAFKVTMNHLADMEPHEYSCWPWKTSCRHRNRLVRSVVGRNRRDGVTSRYDRTLEGDRQERQGDQDDDKHERERIRDNNKDGRYGG